MRDLAAAAAQRAAGATRKTNHQGTKITKKHEGIQGKWRATKATPLPFSLLRLGDLRALAVNRLNL
jgi:hypothetical protein